MNDKLAVIEAPELAQIETSKADAIRKTFEPMAAMLSGFEVTYNELVSDADGGITQELTARAKRLRLDIGRVRIETGKLKDKQKEYIKLEDKAIMGVHNILVWAVKEKEDRLKEIENHFEIQEKNRLHQLQLERVDELSKYIEDAHERSLCEMPDDVWDAYLGAKKKEHYDRVEAEKAAELARIEKEKAEAAERERIRLENEQLKAEAVERERVAKIEAEKRAKVEAARIKKEKAEQEKREKEQREQQRKIEAQRQKEQEELRAERAKIEAEAKKERELVAAEQAKIEAQQLEIEAEKERQRIAKEKAEAEKLDKELQQKLQDEALTVLHDMDTDNELTPQGILDAIIAGKIPHVRLGG